MLKLEVYVPGNCYCFTTKLEVFSYGDCSSLKVTNKTVTFNENKIMLRVHLLSKRVFTKD